MPFDSSRITTAQVITFRPPVPLPGFNARDLMELEDWHIEGRRLVVEQGRDALPGYAAIYEGGSPWATWGLARQGAEVLLWDCVTHADLGRFGSLRAALAAVPATRPERAIRLPPAARAGAQMIRLHPGAMA